MTTKQTLEAVQDESLQSGTLPPVSEGPEPTPETIFPAGTIIECQDCGEGLYRVTQQASTADLVLDEGAVLVPLNQMIPPRHAWRTLACPFCGGRLLRDGKIHTFQHGWQ